MGRMEKIEKINGENGENDAMKSWSVLTGEQTLKKT